MKKYRLLFDTPYDKKGDIFTESEVYDFGPADGCKITDWFEVIEMEKPERWKPEDEEKYWVVSSDGRLIFFRHKNDSIDRIHFEIGNCFRTEAQAQEATRRVKATLQAYQEELLNEEV